MSHPTSSIAVVALLLGVADLAILGLWLAPEVLGEPDPVPGMNTPRDAAPQDAAVVMADAMPAPADAGVPDATVVAVPDIASSQPEPTGEFRPDMFEFLFQQDRATLKSHHHKDLDRAVALLQRFPRSVAVIEGYADASETRYGIGALIKRRIGKIEDHLTGHAIPAERIRTVNHGASAGATETESQKNRRVRLRVELP